jgi:ornithine cyclodeaminase/alanine dehydrogenase-like protein (mu-crystallin family)
MLILTAQDVRKALPMKETIKAMKGAFAALSSGKAEVPLRSRLTVDKYNGLGIFMPAFVDQEGDDALAIKLVTLFNENPAKGLPLIHAAVIIMNAETGVMQAMLEGATLTAIRTGAGCGAATDLLARPDACTAAIFGAGVQARTQLEAVCAVREIETAWIFAPRAEKVQEMISEMAGIGDIPHNLRVATSPTEAVKDADIISAATTSSRPVFEFVDLKPGAHINGAGSYTATMQEIPPELVASSLVTVDARESALVEAGDLVVPIQQGFVGEDIINAEIGEIFSGIKKGRTSEEQFTYFKSVGVAVQDATAGQLALRNAKSMKLGISVEW